MKWLKSKTLTITTIDKEAKQLELPLLGELEIGAVTLKGRLVTFYQSKDNMTM